MSYEQEILHTLSKVGDNGISIRLLAKHVYNMECTLFSQPDLAEIHSYVKHYLHKNSKTACSLIERTDRRGWYRLNTCRSTVARQVMLQFKDTPETANDTAEEPEQAKPQADLSLSLFD